MDVSMKTLGIGSKKNAIEERKGEGKNGPLA